VSRFRSDPQGFLDGVRPPAILDEVQNVPEIFAFVRSRIDRAPRRVGQWFLTGSQEVGLMRRVTESMAGRAAVLQLWPLSARESSKVTLLRGGYPEVLARPRAASLWFSSYLQTYLERDVRAISAIHDLAAFRRFLALVASPHGQVLNKSDLAAPLGMSVPGVGRWLDILEMTAQIILVPPYFENLGKRLKVERVAPLPPHSTINNHKPVINYFDDHALLSRVPSSYLYANPANINHSTTTSHPR